MTGGLKYALLCALVGVLTAWTVRADEAAADWVSYTVPWDCRQTSLSTIPAAADFTLRFNTVSGQTECAEFTKALSDARAYPATDYFSCLQRFSERMESYTWSWCASQKKQPELCTTRRKLGEKFNSRIDEVVDYGAFALKNDAFTPFEPGAPIRPPLGEAAARSRNLSITSWCYFSGSEFLDEVFLRDELPGLLKKSTCDPAALAHDFVKTLLAADVPQAVCERVPERCAQRRTAIRHAFELLTRAGLKDNIGDVAQLMPAKPECKIDDGLDKRLAELYLRSDKLAGCVKQKENDVNGQLIGHDSHSTGTGLSANFKLNRRGDETLAADYDAGDGKVVAAGTKVPVFEASVKLSFHPDDSDVSSSALQEKYAARARECYASEPVSSRLRGPGGEHLKINLLAPDADPKKSNPKEPSANSIAVPATDLRANSGRWNPNISCSVILHETLHILGLVDEYEETSDGAIVTAEGKVSFVEDLSKADKTSKTFKKWDCRITGPRDSMMSSQDKAFETVADMFTVKFCTCDDQLGVSMKTKKGRLGALKCLKLVKTIKAGDKTCPVGTTASEHPWTAEEIKRLTIGQPLGSADNMILDIVPRKPVRASLLYPAQFRAITQPGCVEANKVFFQCTREAYKTSREHLGSDRCNVGLPIECKNGSSDWLR